MSDRSPSTFRYQIGGSLVPESPAYIVRKADLDLLNALLAKEYCYILNARQMGKSSLRVRTMSKLKARGIACGEIELSGIGSQQIAPHQWYGGIIQEIIDGFELKIDRRSWWREREDLSPVQRLDEFIDTVLLRQITSDIVIFIDEIDSILSLDFATDDFINLIHNFYNKRASKPEYRRLTFALLGVATPRELMQDLRTTPFNIGRAIELEGFCLAESMPLARGFGDRFSNVREIMKRILFWTGGQPFLTQKLCRLVKQHSQVNNVIALDELVKTKIIHDWESQDDPEHLRTIRDRLCRHANRNLSANNSAISQELLKIYRKVRKWGKISSRNSQEYLELQLSGVVATDGNRLVVKNQIYQTVFDLDWVDRQLQDLKQNQFSSLSPKKILLVSLTIAGFIVGVRSFGWLEARELQLFDLMMRVRPVETPDPRILLVTVTKDDIKSQPAEERKAASISDRSLARVLTKLERSPAIAIGLDVYREYPITATYQSSIDRVRQNDRFVVICNYGDPGVSASPQIITQDGFNNLFLDSDGIVRRQMLAVNDAKPCRNPYSFNWLLAANYLSSKGIEEKVTESYLQLGKKPFIPLENKTGSYQRLDSRGNQIFLNCRNTPQIAKKITLSEMLQDSFDLNLIRDRIVIIGTVASDFNDVHWRTPCSDQETGVEIQAQMVSQILSHVLDDRPLLWSLPERAEILIIIVCSCLPGTFYRSSRSSLQFAAAIAAMTSIVLGSGEVFLITRGLLLPVLPSIAVLILVGSGLWIYQNRWERDS